MTPATTTTRSAPRSRGGPPDATASGAPILTDVLRMQRRSLGDITPIGWHLGSDALVRGADPVRLTALVLTAVLALGVGLLVFTRRDLSSA